MLDNWMAAVKNGGEGMVLLVAIISASLAFVLVKIMVDRVTQEPTPPKPAPPPNRANLLNDSHIFWLPKT